MKIKYLGVYKEKTRTGCTVCGARTISSYAPEYHLTVTFSNGLHKTFTLNQVMEVTQEQGEYLLKWSYSYKGEERHPFALV